MATVAVGDKGAGRSYSELVESISSQLADLRATVHEAITVADDDLDQAQILSELDSMLSRPSIWTRRLAA